MKKSDFIKASLENKFGVNVCEKNYDGVDDYSLHLDNKSLNISFSDHLYYETMIVVSLENHFKVINLDTDYDSEFPEIIEFIDNILDNVLRMLIKKCIKCDSL